MRHHKAKRKFHREKNQRNALIKSLIRSLVLNDKIETTEAKAKEIRPTIEKMITKSKIDSVANRRLISSRIGTGSPVKKLFEVIGPKYKNQAGGYLRIVKIGARKSDGAKLAHIEFV